MLKNQKYSGLKMIVRIDLKEFKNYLNDYGKVIFGISDENVAKFHSNELPQLFEGSINSSYNIIVVLNDDYENKMRGVYVYEKYGTGIFFDGELHDKKLTLREYTKYFDKNGYINAIYDGTTINGTWSNKNKTKVMTFFAQRK